MEIKNTFEYSSVLISTDCFEFMQFEPKEPPEHKSNAFGGKGGFKGHFVCLFVGFKCPADVAGIRILVKKVNILRVFEEVIVQSVQNVAAAE